MRIKNLTCLVALASALGGCGLFGPTYSQPNTNDPKSFPPRYSSGYRKCQFTSNGVVEVI